MQIPFDLISLSSIIAAVVSFLLSTYLFKVWHDQPGRLYTDLPLMFGFTFIGQALNSLIQGLTLGGFLPSTMTVFRIRSLVICITTFPLLGALLNIWLSKFKDHHLKIMAVLVAYWITISLFAPSQNMIMLLHMPILLVLMLGLIATFFITWRTGKLKEVRSDLLLLSLLLSLVSQLFRIPLLDIGAGFISDVLNVVAILVATLALTNPWFGNSQAHLPESSDMDYM
ncbi:MAG: hypothetical protein KGY80_07030 [Candidatus Thorarchaeota archaeon]|nr:hypothetical protein [Candidatus Thorarchaeota archaeon]